MTTWVIILTVDISIISKIRNVLQFSIIFVFYIRGTSKNVLKKIHEYINIIFFFLVPKLKSYLSTYPPSFVIEVMIKNIF
jgi:hypothetical protein